MRPRLLLTAALAVGCSSKDPAVTVGSSPGGAPSGAGSASAPAPGESGSAGPAPVAAAAFARVPGKKPEGDGSSFSVGGKKFPAPSGRAFEAGLGRDLDGDGKEDLVAWARSPDGKRGELVVAHASAPEDARTLFALPSDALGGAACAPAVAIALIGPALASLDVGCAERRDEGPRWAAAIALPSAASDAGAPESGPVVVELSLAARPPGEALELQLSTVDRGGKAAIAVGFTLRSPLAPLPRALPVSAQIVLLPGATGWTPDPNEPEMSMGRVAGSLVADAKKRTSAGHVDADAVALARLRQILCGAPGEKPAPAGRLLPLAGCGEPRAVGEAGYARILAAQSRAEPVRAYGAYAAWSLHGRKAEGEAILDKLAPKASVTEKKLTTAVLFEDGGPVPVAFDAAGVLFVRTRAGAARLDASFAEAPAEADPFPKAIPLKGGELEVAKVSCDAPALALAVKKGAPVALPLVTPPHAAGRCEQTPAWVGVHEDGTVVLSLGGQLVGVASDLKTGPGELIASAPKAGHARSPDGLATALPTPRGVLVAQASGARLFDHASLRKPGGLLCAPANGGKRIACASAGGVAVYDAK